MQLSGMPLLATTSCTLSHPLHLNCFSLFHKNSKIIFWNFDNEEKYEQQKSWNLLKYDYGEQEPMKKEWQLGGDLF